VRYSGKPATQNAGRFQRLDDDVGVVGDQIFETATLQMLAHRRLRK
jgi:hypothetical protein